MLHRIRLPAKQLLSSSSFLLSKHTTATAATATIPNRSISPFSSKHNSQPAMSQQSNDSGSGSGSDNNNNINNRGLPAPGDPSQITLDVSAEGGSTAKLSSIGPLVVNVDGTVARITNWAEMTEPERETTLRMVGKRNKQRLAALKAKKEAEEGSGGGGNADGK